MNEFCISFRLDVRITLPSAVSVASVKVFGIPWFPQGFIDQAKNVTHPFAPELAIPKQLTDALDKHFAVSDAKLAKLRTEFISKWTHRAVQLQGRREPAQGDYGSFGCIRSSQEEDFVFP